MRRRMRRIADMSCVIGRICTGLCRSSRAGTCVEPVNQLCSSALQRMTHQNAPWTISTKLPVI